MSARRQARAAARTPQAQPVEPRPWIPSVTPKGVTQTRISTPTFVGQAWFRGSPTPYMLRDDTGTFYRGDRASALWAQLLPHLTGTARP